MDEETIYKILFFFVVVASGVFMASGMKADSGQSTWATRCQLFGGLGLFGLMGLVFLLVIGEEFFDEAGSIALACGVAASALVFTIGLFGFCARYGATCRRVTQLEEIESALEAAVAHSEAQDRERGNQ
ncbi:hypothetical protein [Roseibacillus persicicus]|uniref:hypothetical protein n=1 Tax=Roseibacillus persicicus TaxID=454148 RepID=UPI00280C4041|nr:hypothetical protein [Roseibacillus persicicus]MDQ8191016.1 hypothetical protein [Roseibacillus persicicus]